MQTELEPVAPDLERNILTLSDRAMQITVTNDQELLVADAIKSECLAMRKAVIDFFAPLKKKAHEAHKALTTAENAELDKIIPGENHIKSVMAEYQLEQKRIREAEEARLLKLAREREEADRLERAAEIEKEAAAMKAAGNVEEAAAIQEEAEQVLATPVYVASPRMAAPPKTKNALKMIVDRERLQTVADGLTKGTIKTPPSIPGVRFYQTWSVEIFASANVPDAWRKPA